MVQSTVSGMKKIKNNQITITCAFFMRLLSVCRALNDWKKKVEKSSISSSKRMEALSANQFQWVHMNDIPFVEDLLTLNILLYHIDFVDIRIIGKILDRVSRITEILCYCWDTTNTNATSTTIMQSSNLFAALFVTPFSTEYSIQSEISLHALKE